MSLTPGTQIGPYQIITMLGAGGMGEVYKARDTRLDRTVAVKVLPATFQADAQFRERFNREARAVSQLTHPHICTLYDVGDQQGMPFLVLEYLEGETLADRLKLGALSLDDALEVAIQIAEALSTAHRHGIVHRDLKPGNVMLTRSGAKLLDFGLAKTGAYAAAGLSSVPTSPAHLTTLGTILGTFQYMAPEQIEGNEVDARTDIFAFGMVLYEMLTGRKTFAGKTHATLISAILKDEPCPITELQPLTPPALERALKRCLAKSADGRWESAWDLADELRWIRDTQAAASSRAAAQARMDPWKKVAIGSMVVLAAAAATLTFRRDPQLEPRASERLNIALPADAPVASVAAMPLAGDKPALAISPDGSGLAYVAQRGGGTQIVIRDMTTAKTSALTGTEGGHTPFFSPDGALLAFFAGGKLKKISLAGGGAVGLADAPNGWGGVWAPDDVIYFNRLEGEGLVKMSAAGGPLEVAYDQQGAFPALLPEGRGLLVYRGGGISVVDSGKARELLPVGFGAHYAATGHLVYALPGKLMGVRFDLRELRPIGSPAALVTDLRTGPYGVAQFALSARGTLVYVAGSDQLAGSFLWADREGHTRDVGLPEAPYGSFSVSPDGTRLAVELASDTPAGGSEIWIYDLERPGARVRVTPRAPDGGHSTNIWPRWTPDGKHIIYWSRPAAGVPGLVVAPTDRSGQAETLWSRTPTGPTFLYPMSFSPDGSVLAAFGPETHTNFDVYTLSVTGLDGSSPGASALQPLLKSPYAEVFPQFSPDGHAIAYGSDESGQYEIYVTTYPRQGPRCHVSKEGGTDPAWMPDGQSIVFQSGTAILEAQVKSVPRCDIGAPRALFRGAYPDRPGFGRDMTRDGRLLLIENKSVSSAPPTLSVVTNFFDELGRLVP